MIWICVGVGETEDEKQGEEGRRAPERSTGDERKEKRKQRTWDTD